MDADDSAEAGPYASRRFLWRDRDVPSVGARRESARKFRNLTVAVYSENMDQNDEG
jgi:hypothetical protein